MRKVQYGCFVDGVEEIGAIFHPDRGILPQTLFWTDGTEFPIDSIVDIRRAASMKAGGFGMRYTVRIEGQLRHLWLEEGNEKWFVEGTDEVEKSE